MPVFRNSYLSTKSIANTNHLASINTWLLCNQRGKKLGQLPHIPVELSEMITSAYIPQNHINYEIVAGTQRIRFFIDLYGDVFFCDSHQRQLRRYEALNIKAVQAVSGETFVAFLTDEGELWLYDEAGYIDLEGTSILQRIEIPEGIPTPIKDISGACDFLLLRDANDFVWAAGICHDGVFGKELDEFALDEIALVNDFTCVDDFYQIRMPNGEALQVSNMISGTFSNIFFTRDTHEVLVCGAQAARHLIPAIAIQEILQLTPAGGLIHDQLITPKNPSIQGRMALTTYALFYIDTNGQLYGRGNINFIQANMQPHLQAHFIPLFPALKFKKIVASDTHILALTTVNTIVSWGLNRCGCLGTGDVNDRDFNNPSILTFNYPVMDIQALENASYIITQKGHVYAYGLNDFIEEDSCCLGISHSAQSVNLADGRVVELRPTV